MTTQTLNKLHKLQTLLHEATDIQESLPKLEDEDFTFGLRVVIRKSLLNALGCCQEWKEICLKNIQKDKECGTLPKN